MRVLVIGSGGREAAMAWACGRHGHDVTVHRTGVAPVELPDDVIRRHDLVLPGPETALAAGIADRCAALDVPCFGPGALLAKLEASKGYARDLATDLGIPGPAFARFAAGEAEAALDWWHRTGHDVVVKLDGLAGGKGVTVPADAAATRAAIVTAAAAGAFVLEQRMEGAEYSLLALCDGHRAVVFPLAQDHKRIGEGDTGPNTGGMGAYAPAPAAVQAEDLLDTFVQPLLDHLASVGTPYVGVLYAGLMVTADGPQLVEYNCRFGDPEAQTLLPLLRDDLAELALLCTRGHLHQRGEGRLLATQGAACTVVAAAPGYPDAPQLGALVTSTGFADVTTVGPAHDVPDTWLFPAGVNGDGRVTGGRVLAVTGTGPDLAAARDRAYQALGTVSFPGMHLRRDIAWRAPGAAIARYADTGVDIDEGARAVHAMRAAVESTHTPAVLGGVGSFGGVLDLGVLTGMTAPVLVASTDGVGTKVELAARLGRVRGVGADIVNHCIDDVLVQGARPLAFLDYIAAAVLQADMVAEVVTGMAEACAAAGCVLLGGETAEMPGVYAPGAFDIAGTLIGVAERHRLLPRLDVAAGDVLIGLASSGPHTNGYSFLRHLFAWFPMDAEPDGLGRPLGEALLEPHRSYLDPVGRLLDGAHGPSVKALAHITGGGFVENIPRVLPQGTDAVVRLGSWPLPPLFRLVRDLATAMSTHELYRVVNMGIGMVLVVAATEVEAVLADLGEPSWVIGEVVDAVASGHPRTPEVHLVDG